MLKQVLNFMGGRVYYKSLQTQILPELWSLQSHKSCFFGLHQQQSASESAQNRRYAMRIIILTIG